MISADQFLTLCKTTADEIIQALTPLIGTEFGGEEIAVGADNTPTERLDKVAEDIVLKNFRAVKACKSLLSEEAGLVDIGGDCGIAYLDPVDGSFNAAAGLPFYALSIALSNGVEVVAGFVMDLASGEVFSAVKGKGSYRNDTLLHPSKVTELKKASISYYAHKKDRAYLIEKNISVRRTRQFGASALELCYVAAGRLDAFVDLRGNLRITDAAAGIFICEEAGVKVSKADGTTADFPNAVCEGRTLIAAAEPLYSEIRNALSGDA